MGGKKVLGTCFCLGELLLFATAIQHVGRWVPVRIFFALIRPTLYRNDCSCLLRSLMRRLRNTESIFESFFSTRWRLRRVNSRRVCSGFDGNCGSGGADIAECLLFVVSHGLTRGWGWSINHLCVTSPSVRRRHEKLLKLGVIRFKFNETSACDSNPSHTPAHQLPQPKNFLPIVFYRLQIPQNDEIFRWLRCSNF